ncbi:hypothetical protein SLEP1_g48850 [Rubroshorea leprosula]|uniref:RING-type E3 ubiquitin transferase n=1 Tax=Rubroshorea leprosula TaxID=152421 RepID=A0AAV5LXU6_9ROSI|nr:hypothetical protein SLEP1_g48850 [Rubroshorea leprosula]
MVREEPKESPQNSNQASPIQNDGTGESLLSPRFKSIAAMAGWDEEALIVASLVVEDTPDRICKQKKRSNLVFVSPPSTNSRRKRRAQRRSAVPISVAPLDLDDEETSKEESEKKKMEEQKIVVSGEKKKKTGRDKMSEENPDVSCSNPALPCIDKLREELSCAICLEICYEPSTTPCGHSFCKKCLRSAAGKCGKRCPKCRQLISNGRSCTVNTVLWNTIQLLFPQEVEARQAELQSPVKGTHSNRRIRSSQSPMEENGIDTRWRRRGARSQNDGDAALAARSLRQDNLSQLTSSNTSSRRRRGMPRQDVAATPLASRPQRNTSSRRRRGTPSQDANAALALRLQREEFMESFVRNHEQSRPASLSLARANLRAMASRAIKIRTRGQ